MTYKFCPICGGDFYQDEPWKTLCLDCWIKSKNAEKTVAVPVHELQDLHDRLAHYELSLALADESSFESQFKERIKDIIFHCHPDKHGNTQRATDLTQWLIGFME